MNLDSLLETHAILILLGSIVLYFSIRGLIVGINSKTWPSTLGTIAVSEIESDTEDFVTTSYTKIRYSYEVGNKKYYSTMRLTGLLGVYPSAKAILEKYPIGKVMTVYFRPQDPKTCRLTTGDTFWDYAYIFAVLLVALLVSRNLIVVLLIIGIAVVLNLVTLILYKIWPTIIA